MARRHLIGLLLAAEEDWPTAFAAVLRRVGSVHHGGETHELTSVRITNEPFDLRYVPRYSLVIDRLAWWYDLPREWLKKVALRDDVDRECVCEHTFALTPKARTTASSAGRLTLAISRPPGRRPLISSTSAWLKRSNLRC